MRADSASAMREACERHRGRVTGRPSAAEASTNERLRLAYVSPLPPERSGIADYSAELIPALSDYYDIEVITDQAEVSNPWLCEHVTVRSCAWFEQNTSRYDRILYHMGNSALHAQMLGL